MTGLLLAGAACAESNPSIGRELGQTTFVSADGPAGSQTQNRGDALGAPTDGEAAFGDDAGDERTVEEGDIYRSISAGLLANLNAYRGLQLIDISTPSAPQIIGRLQVSGSPLEMYVVGDTAFVLMNNWYGYYGTRYAAALEQANGGMVAAIDISDPTSPQLLEQAFVPGYLSTSRLTQEGAQAALYVVTGGWLDGDGDGTYETTTVVKSFDVSNGALTAKTQLDLGGYVSDIQATTSALLVARYDWSGSGGSDVTLIDIRDPSGVMLQGDTITAAGMVDNQFNLDLDGTILRVVSGGSWSGSATNHLQTYDASDFANLVPIDHETFGANEDLYATLFLGEKAFFVTYLRQDPFHAFEIDANGFATEKSEFVVSGWNDFFRAALGDTRLIGIGIDDQTGWNVAVSLYDISDLTNATPLLARQEVDASGSWSEANWDHRAFSVIENAVTASGPGGEAETGVVLVPFSGWDAASDTYTSAVQIFTFSDTTLTRRGLMDHGSPVRRSFAAGSATANLSEAELSLFDASAPDAPTELGRVELAPNYVDALRFGAYRVRVNNRAEGWYGWTDAVLPARAEVIDAADDPDHAAALTTFEVPGDADLYKSGDLLVAVSSRWLDTSSWPYTTETTLTVYDLADPLNPQPTGELVTDRLDLFSGWGWGWDFAGEAAIDCFDCGGYWGGYWGGGTNENIKALPKGLAILESHYEEEVLGSEHVCVTYAGGAYDCANDSSCHWVTGSRECHSFDGQTQCWGEFYLCEWDGSETTCSSTDLSGLETQEYCYDQDRIRSWQRFELEVLDLTDKTAPQLVAPLSLADGDEGVSMVVDGSDVWLNYKRPVQVAGDPRPFVAYYAKRFDLATPSAPQAGASLNLPGELLEIQHGSAGYDYAFTRDLVWGENVVETSIAQVRLYPTFAMLEAHRVFPDQLVEAILLDGAGHVLVSHRTAWSMTLSAQDQEQKLTVLNAGPSSLLQVLSQTPIDSYATLEGAKGGRGLFQVPGGLLVLNLDDAQQPYPQAFFPTRGWPRRVELEGSTILAPAGAFGIYAFDVDTFNLLSH